MSKSINSILLIVFLLFVSAIVTKAQDTTKYNFPSVNILGVKSSSVDYTPGTVNIINSKVLQMTRGLNGTQAFETIPGVNVVDEEGVGLRMNMSIRGLDPDRSRSILVLEDGMPTALAPYGEPEMYYTPLMDKMSSVEILKGSGSIIHGPQTIGGVINFLTNEPNDIPGLGFKFNGGSGGFVNSKIAYGTTTSDHGFLVEYNHKSADKIGVTQFGVNDLMFKFNVAFNSRSSIKFKLGFYDEESNSTYVGITQNMFDNGDYFTHVAPDDILAIRRYSAQLSHQYIVNNNMFFVTNFYGYTTTRNWNRQNFSSSKPSDWTGDVYGDTTISGGALYMRNSTGNRDRQFEVMGVQPQIYYNYDLGGLKNEMTAGVRMHYERAFEQTINGKVAGAIKGDLVADEVRTGYAGSAFIQNRFFALENLIITPGARFEQFNYERVINRVSSKDTNIVGNNDVSAIIPGIGVNYNFHPGLGLFAGIHKGFAPPRTKDAINNSGVSIDLEAELSWNSEIGFRADFDKLVNIEVTGYQLNFSNQIIPISESSGGLGTDVGYVNGGSTLHWGIESAIGFNISQMLKTDYAINLSTTFNYGKSTYDADRFIPVAEGAVNVKGNELPYAPNFSFSTSLLVATPFGTSFYVTGKYLDKQFTDELNTVAPSANGRAGVIDSRFIINATIEHRLDNPNLTLFVSLKNITDERYISSRRPQGIKVGLPQMFVAGVDFRI
ncbi:MAG: TonB-dependent receptor plug domain-containing protein [Candidatus Kapabacteria bacterium]|nr:TonB-dependent receptor plug domain-containing protein [Candidatus Kapabacteria bacterium]